MINLPTGPYCLIQKQDDESILLLKGKLIQLDNLDQLPRATVNSTNKVVYSSISVIPFSQAKEKEYSIKDGGDKILSIEIEEAVEIDAAKLIEQIDSIPVELKEKLSSNYSDKGYQDLVNDIIEKEIKRGEGCNFVIPRKFEGQIKDFDNAKALSIFKSLLQTDYGTYWKFLFFTGEKYFIGSTPERHLEVTKGKVKMNPISGTFRKTKDYTRRRDIKKDLLEFLTDEKEINELFMVVDEEMKMMTKMCEKGGSLAGPLLKEMSRLIHTEYLLVGESDKTIIELLRESMFAATVTGSPIKNAFEIINKYENIPRGYYGGAIALIGNDEEGHEFLDSPILIRTLEINAGGSINIKVGATLVRDSVPLHELEETNYKISAVFNSLTNSGNTRKNDRLLTSVMNDDDIHYALVERNQNLSNFWFRSQSKSKISSSIKGCSVTIVDNEDDFVQMMSHLLTQLGVHVKIVNHTKFSPEKFPSDLYLIGPGPGDPNNQHEEKMNRNLGFIDQLMKSKKNIFCICLAHQILSKYLGLDVIRKDKPSQGLQKEITLFGEPEIVGFYNTFVPVKSRNIQDVEFSLEQGTNEILAMRGANFASFQFHPESILTKNGESIIDRTIFRILDKSSC